MNPSTARSFRRRAAPARVPGVARAAGEPGRSRGRAGVSDAFGRYIRPGAVRVGASSPDSSLRVSAFRNKDGSLVVEVLNNSATAQPVSVQGVSLAGASAYLTDESDSLTPETAGAGLQAPPTSLTTIVIPARAGASDPSCEGNC
jgi:hypothetical protein